jgi:acetyl esterase
MPLDPAAQALLDQLAAAEGPPLNEMSPAEAREVAAGLAGLGGEGEAVAAVADRTVPGPGGDLPVRVYTPAGSGPFAALLYIHGGGWVIGDIELTDSVCRALCNAAGIVVASVDYRLAPEHKYPAPLDDCMAALQWLAANAAELGVDPGRLAVGGDSAGGNLSAAVALRARDEGGPALRHQVLVYPVTDHGTGTASYEANGTDYFLTTDMMRWFWDHYVTSEADAANPYVSPLRAEDLSGLPAATVLTAEYDPLRDEGEAYAARLQEAGVAVTAKRYDGQIHGFWSMIGVMPAAKQAVADVAADLRRSLA